MSIQNATENKINYALLDKTMEHIEANLVAWNQRNWRSIPGIYEGKPQLLPTPCGTAMCFAGEAIQLTSPEDWFIQPSDIKYAIEKNDPVLLDELNSLVEFVVDRDGIPNEGVVLLKTHPITKQETAVTFAGSRGRAYLGLDEDSANALFFEDNTIEDLRSAVAHLQRNGNLWNWERPSYNGEDEND